jgi:hypothetical protein
MGSRVLAKVLTSAMLATAISMLAACGGTAANLAQGGRPSSAAALSGPSAGSPPRSADPGQSHASAPAAQGSGTAAQHTPAQPGPQTATQQKTQPPPASSAGSVRFGAVTCEDSNSSTDVSSDGGALTTLFSDQVASLQEGPQSTGTRMVIPLTGGAQNRKLTVYASGYAITTEHTTARLSLTVNGQTVVKDFPAGTEGEFVQPLKLPAIAGSDYQLSFALEVHQAAGSDDGDAYLNVSSIDAEIT